VKQCPKCKNSHNKPGAYCCRKCANSRVFSCEAILKKSISAKTSQKVKKAIELRLEKRITKTCPVCKNTFNVPACNIIRIYCSTSCYNNDIGKKYKKKAPGGYRKGSGIGISGWYKGFYCDSSWELAYVIYCLDNNINIIRNTMPRHYIWNGVNKKYFPDFIVQGILTEIKGYKTDQWKAKLKYNPDVRALYKEDLIDVFEYVENKYGKNFIELYE